MGVGGFGPIADLTSGEELGFLGMRGWLGLGLEGWCALVG